MLKWNFFDTITCINLKSRPDKLDHCRRFFDFFSIPATVFSAEKHANPKQGCFESHIETVCTAYKAGAEHVLVLEDDFLPTNLNPITLNEVILFLKRRNAGCDIFYLGCYIDIDLVLPKTRVSENIYRVRPMGTHAYIMTRSGMAKVANAVYRRHTIDAYYRKRLRGYAHLPTLFSQRNVPNDIDYIIPYEKFRELYHVVEYIFLYREFFIICLMIILGNINVFSSL
jgi:glycosyl transferase family 25